MDTIFAQATAPGKAGVAIIRVSGPDAWQAAAFLCGSIPSPRLASVRVLRDRLGNPIDEALVLVFEKNRSFTGEPVVEFQVHGSIAVVRAILAELGRLDGLRLAEAGEFTRRALINDRLDLTQVEALADLLDAETESQRQQAIKGFTGGFADVIASWRNDLISAVSLLEVTIDFSDEEIPVDVTDDVRKLLTGVATSVQQQLLGFSAAERVKTGFEVAIVGEPNSGKSSLLNALAGRDVAITSDIAGTTRDVIEVRMDLQGLAVTLLDTAGLRGSDDDIERIGIQRAIERARNADLRIFLSDMDAPYRDLFQKDDIEIRSKADLTGDLDGISAETGQGLDALMDKVSSVLLERAEPAGLVTAERHRIALEVGYSALVTALSVLEQGVAHYDIASEEIRTAIRRLEVLVGRVGVETVLDRIFSSFCLGK